MNWLEQKTAFYGYRVFSRFAEILPRSAVQPLARGAAKLAIKTSRPRVELVRSNLRRVTGEEPTDEMVVKAFASYFRYWLELFRLPVLDTEQLDRGITAENFEAIEAARAAGKGVVAVLPHMGNWDMVAAWLVRRGVPLTVVVERLEPVELFRWFKDFRQRMGMTVVANEPGVSSALTGALHRNELIALLSDRDVDGTGIDVEFFGETTKLPKGPAVLALRTGAALLPVAIFENGEGYVAKVGRPISVERSGTLKDDVERVTRDVASTFELLIREAPEQWHLFQPNWPSDRR